MPTLSLPPETIELTDRFFSALNALSQQKVIRGKATFVKRYGLDLRNFYKVQEHQIRIKPEWLVYLVRDYNVSSEWLLMGRGGMFGKK
jgi:hypothetical protein